MNHEQYIRRALDLAQRGRGRVSPNPMVGCVIVKAGRVIAQGWHAVYGGDHAEIVALKKLGLKAFGATMYVTLEPCAHFGKTPPCVDDVIACGIREIYIAMQDPNPLTAGRSIRKMKKAGIKVHVGLLQAEARALNEAFIKYITHKMPFVTAKCAQTLDGKIATATGDSKWITADSTRSLTRKARGEFDAIMVGINTVLADNPRLSVAGSVKRLKKIVIDSTLKTPYRAKLFEKTLPSDVYLVTTAQASRKTIWQFVKKGCKVLVAPSKGKDKHVNLKWVMKELAKQKIANILIEGGGRLIGHALKDGLVDKMKIYIAPKIMGDQNAVSAITGLNIQHIEKALALERISIQYLKPDILIEGYIK